MKQYNLVVSGGTFDHFHKGHKAFLRFALSLGENVLIGITSDTFVGKNRPSSGIALYKKREQVVRSFLEKEGFLAHAKILPIDTIFIPKQWEILPIDAIVVTDDSASGAQIINTDRKKRGLSELPIKLFHLISAQDGLPISATRIRKGVINREGELFIKPDWLLQTLVLPESIRGELKQPIGEIIRFETFDFSTLPMEGVVTVGDVTAKLFHERGFFPRLSLVDFLVKREKIYTSLQELGFRGDEKEYVVLNPAGQITGKLFRTIKELFETSDTDSGRFVIRVEGEEDLAVLPVVLAVPLGFHVFYGQPGVGTVHVVVTEDLKQRLSRLLMGFLRA